MKESKGLPKLEKVSDDLDFNICFRAQKVSGTFEKGPKNNSSNQIENNV